MGVFGVVGLSLDIAGAAGDKKAQELEQDFQGELNINIGTVLNAVFGTQYNHFFGSQRQLVASGRYMGVGAFLGEFLSKGGFSSILGLSGQSEFTFGKWLRLVYGGPYVDIRRGPTIERISITPPDLVDKTAEPNTLNLVADELNLFQQLAGPQDAVGLEMEAQAGLRAKSVRCLAVLLSLSTAALELAIRFKYPDYTPGGSAKKQEKEDTDPFSTPHILDETAANLSSVLMGLLYYYEAAGTWTDLGKYCLVNAQVKFQQATGWIVNGPKAAANWYADTFNECDLVGKMVMVALTLLILAGIALGLYFAAEAIMQHT